MSDTSECKVVDSRFVEPCGSLSGVVSNHSPAFSRAKGVAHWQLHNMSTGEPARSYFGVITKSQPNGFLFNVCPWCGTDISAPFTPLETDT